MQMATPSTPTNPPINDNSNSTTFTSRSYFQTAVRLSDWWLVKAEKDFQGKRLAVAGIPHREQEALRVFSSAPILKRYGLFNLETADGVCLIIKGLINKARTEENGFPSEVFDHFIFGFPPYWEKYALNCFGGEPPAIGAAQSNPDSEKFFPEAANDNLLTVVPATVDFNDFPRKNYDKASTEKAEDNNCKKNSSIKDSPAGGKKESTSNLKGGEAKPSVAISQQKSGPVRFSHTDSPGSYNSGLSPTAPEISEKEPSPGDSSVEHMETLELSGNNLDGNVRQPLAQSRLEENSVPPSDQDNMSTDEDGKQGQNNEHIRKRASRVIHSPIGHGGIENKKEKNARSSKQHISQPANFSAKKESLVTPKKKEESCIASPESLSLRRSRSGRLLVPTMQFWRNQRAVYDADRRIMGIKDPQLNQPTEGSRSEPQRKKRSLR